MESHVARDPALARLLTPDRLRAVVGDRTRLDAVIRIPADAVLRIQKQRSLSFAEISETVERRVFGRRDLGLHVEVRVGNTIVTRHRELVLAHIMAAEVISFLALHKRLQQEVAEIGTPRAIEVRLRKAERGRVVPPIAAAVLPARPTRIRRGLHRPERHRRPREGMAVIGRPDERPDIPRTIFALRRTTQRPHTRGTHRQQHVRLHSLSFLILNSLRSPTQPRHITVAPAADSTCVASG